MKKIVISSIFLLTSVLFVQPLFAHCEIPCGIYGDEMRFDMIAEHVTTIEKAMKQIIELSKQRDKNHHQLVRWIVNKEKHANYIQEIVYQYFMTQRVKPADEKNMDKYKEYVNKMTLLHKMLVYAMKCKQTTDLDNVKKLRSLLASFRSAYFGR